jgi:hypothetical protein
MKKEIIAGLILALLFAGSVVNIHYMDSLADELIGQVETAQSYARAGDYARAKAEVGAAIDRWSKCDGYTHIFIRHPEIDSATDALYELYDSVAGGDAALSEGAFGKVEAHMRSIAGMEHITIGSIL